MSNTVLSSALPLTSIIATATQLGIENATTFQRENLFNSIDAALIYLTLIRFLDYNDFRKLLLTQQVMKISIVWWYFVHGMYFSPIQSNFSLFALTVNSSPHKTTIFKLAAVLDMPKDPFLRLIFEIDMMIRSK